MEKRREEKKKPSWHLADERRGSNLMVDLLIYKPFNPFTLPTPDSVWKAPVSSTPMPPSIRCVNDVLLEENNWEFVCLVWDSN